MIAAVGLDTLLLCDFLTDLDECAIPAPQVYESEVGAQARAAVQPLGDREGEVDLCVTLGGDGTVLFTATLFPSDAPMPPIVSFSMGTLGFLTPFDVRDFRESLSRVMRSYGGKDCTGETLDSSLLKVG